MVSSCVSSQKPALSSSARHFFAGVPQIEMARPHLDGQLVERQMALRQPQRFLELVFPVAQRLARTGIDEIEARAWKDRLREAHGADGFIDRMLAAEFGQRSFAQGLDAERDAVDAGGAIAAEAIGLDQVGLASSVISAFGAMMFQ